ncbi:MAG: adenylate/guanylate cyclase domain-containing protein [Spirochaetota bacterium]
MEKADSKQIAKNQRTFRFTIIFILTSLIFLSSGMVYVLSYFTGKNSIAHLSDKLMQRIASHTLDRSLSFLGAATKGSTLSEDLVEEGVISLKTTKAIIPYFRELLQLYPQFESIYYGDVLGNFYMVKKMEDRSISVKKVLRSPRRKLAYTIWEHANPKYAEKFPNQTQAEADAYEPRKRPWFTSAQKEGKLVWTDAYVFSSDQKPGISCASPVYDAKHDLRGVISIDIGLGGLSYFLANMRISESDQIFVLNNKEELIAIPAKDPNALAELVQTYKVEEKTKYKFLKISEAKNKVIASSYGEFKKHKKQKSDGSGSTVHQIFKYKGENYISLYIPFPKESGFQWHIGIVMPEKNFMAEIDKNNRMTLLFCIVFVILATASGIWFSKRVSEPLRLLAEEMDKIKEFQLDTGKKVASNLAEVSNIASSFERMRTALKSFMKYVPAELVRDLVHMQKEAVLGGEKKDLTILFSDIANFTSISEQLSPEELVDNLEEYLSVMSEQILEDGGTVDKYIGDAIMAFWGAPRTQEDHAIRACRSALICQQKLVRLFSKWEQQGKPAFHTRIGLNSSEVIVGNMGSSKRINYTVIGDGVNLASRLEALNKMYGTRILVSESTYELAKSHYEFCLLDVVAVKGKTTGVAIYELVAEKGKLPLGKREFIDMFHEGFRLYKEHKFKQAEEIFKYLEKEHPDGSFVRVFIDRCEDYLSNPPDQHWNGVFVAKTK